jgi:hypothetical protein
VWVRVRTLFHVVSGRQQRFGIQKVDCRAVRLPNSDMMEEKRSCNRISIAAANAKNLPSTAIFPASVL